MGGVGGVGRVGALFGRSCHGEDVMICDSGRSVSAVAVKVQDWKELNPLTVEKERRTFL